MTIINKELVGEGALGVFEYPNVPIGIYIDTVFKENFANHGDAQWFTDVSTGKSMKYGQMINAIRSVASGLRKRGLQTGDNVVVMGPNLVEFPLMSLGTWRAGGSLACPDHSLPSDVIEMRMRDVKCKFVLTDFANAHRITEITRRLDFVKEVFVMGDEPVLGCTPFHHLLNDSGEECPANLDDVDMDSMAWLPYTSGTIGLSKAIVLTHRTVVGLFSCRSKTTGNSPVGSKHLFVNLICYPSGMTSLLRLSLCHANTYWMSNYSLENLLDAMQSAKPSAVGLYPYHVSRICRYQQLDHYHLSSIKSISIVGSKIHSTFEREIFEKFPNLRALDNLYGMTETGLICHTHPNQQERAKLFQMEKSEAIKRHAFDSIGRVSAYCKVKVVDVDSGEKLGPNQNGELCVQSPFMLKEYLNRPEETVKFLRNGWAHTGDKGYYVENGLIYIVGRIKETFKHRDIEVIPANIEKHLVTHPAVKDVAVIGLPDEMDGERPLAFVVLSPGQKIAADGIIAFANERLTEEEKLYGGVRFIDQIPRNNLGKIVRLELTKLL